MRKQNKIVLKVDVRLYKTQRNRRGRSSLVPAEIIRAGTPFITEEVSGRPRVFRVYIGGKGQSARYAYKQDIKPKYLDLERRKVKT